MKQHRTIIIGILLVYGFLTMGLNIMVHTCAGTSETIVGAMSAEDPCACGDEMSADDMCCTTSVTSLKIDDVQLNAATIHLDRTDEVIGTIAPVVIIPHSAHYGLAVFTDTSPPYSHDKNILFSQFLI